MGDSFQLTVYADLTGDLRVDISPLEAVSLGAQWRLTAGPDTAWKNSGDIVNEIPIDDYTIEFKDVYGWNKPSAQPITIPSTILEISANYTQTNPNPDIDSDGSVNLTDFSLFAVKFLLNNCQLANNGCDESDVNFSGAVDIVDLLVFAEHWLTTYTAYFSLSTSVPLGNGTLIPLSGFYPEGEVVTLNAIPTEGYRVKAWTGTDNDASTSVTNTVTMDADKNVTVEFEPSVSEIFLTFDGMQVSDEVIGSQGTHIIGVGARSQGQAACNFQLGLSLAGLIPFEFEFDSSFVSYPWAAYTINASYDYLEFAGATFPFQDALLMDYLLLNQFYQSCGCFVTLYVTGYTRIDGIEYPVGTTLDQVYIHSDLLE